MKKEPPLRYRVVKHGLASISPTGTITTLLVAGAPLDGPASVASERRHRSRKTLYLVNGSFMRIVWAQARHPGIRRCNRPQHVSLACRCRNDLHPPAVHASLSPQRSTLRQAVV